MSASSAAAPFEEDDFDDDVDMLDEEELTEAELESEEESELGEAEPVRELSAVSEPIEEASESVAPAKQKVGFGRRLRKWIVRLLGFAIIVGLAAGAYALWPTFNERFIQTVENNAEDLGTVQERLAEFDETTAELAATNEELDSRIDELAATQSETTGRLDSVEELIAAQTTRIDDLDELSATLSTELEDTSAQAAIQLDTTRAAELMSRARLFLFQANYGLAAADIESARTTVDALDANAEDQVRIDEVVDRLDLSLANLPDRPVAAAADLDVAWQALLGAQPTPGLAFSDADAGEGASAEESEESGTDGAEETADSDESTDEAN